MSIRRVSRLPGIAFERQRSMPRDILPRMDIALFVGFAATGPLHLPIPLEDEAHFKAIFGDDAPLVWDATAGERLYASLGPAVRAFFREGGTRCWVVRVADRSMAAYNTYRVPGLARARFDAAGAVAGITSVQVSARSPGRWSDNLSAATSLLSRALPVAGDPLALRVDPSDVAVGDWLRFTFADSAAPLSPDRYVLMYGVEGLRSPAASDSDRRSIVQPRRLLWFDLKPPAGASTGMVWLETDSGEEAIAAWLQTGEGNSVTLLLDTMPTVRPQYGQFVRVNFAGVSGWLMIEDVSEKIDITLSPFTATRRLLLQGQGLWWMASAPTPRVLVRIETLTFQLLVREGMSYPVSVSDLGFDRAHPRYWGALPDDDTLYRARHDNWHAQVQPDAFEHSQADLWREVTEPRFPLAARLSDDQDIFFPLAIPTLTSPYVTAMPTNAPAITRDGLRDFNADLFLDPRLKGFCAEALLPQANFLRYVQEPPYIPIGIHTLLELDEVTLVAAPDLMHRGWVEAIPSPGALHLPNIAEEEMSDCEPAALDQIPFGAAVDVSSTLVVPSLSVTTAEGSGSYRLFWTSDAQSEGYIVQEAIGPNPQGAATVYTGPATHLTLHRQASRPYFYRVRAFAQTAVSPWSVWKQVESNFQECEPFELVAPTLTATTPDDTGSYVLSWSGDVQSEGTIVQEVAALTPREAVTLYTGAETSLTLYRHPYGHYFYRVRSYADDVLSPWSLWKQVTVTASGRWQIRPATEYSPKTLLEVQQKLIQICAARGDCMTVLALPEHYREEDAILHADALRALFVPARRGKAAELLQMNGVKGCSGEARALTYGALYHPWLIVRETERDTPPRALPPDGAACGVIANRTLTRGAWIAPANETLQGVVALTPPIHPDAWLTLQEAGINLFRHEPRGFLALCADTLAADEDNDLRPINVRRLLILLRRTALQQGNQYVFEPNSDSFRRLVQRGFESMMQYLFIRGAFAGSHPDSAYRVVVDATVNPPANVDQGRFIVELRVAPSLPLTFMTVRLVQTGDRALQIEFR